MATTEKAKSTGRSRSATSKAAGTKRPATQRGKRPASRSNGSRRAAVRQRIQEVPTWATALASVVSVGVAVGVGLFATRNQWLPQAEEWGDQLRERFGKGQDDDDDDYYIDDDDWEGGDPETASFPSPGTGATASGAV